jgi:RNA polymerase sigma-70 factor, ECF subfamily
MTPGSDGPSEDPLADVTARLMAGDSEALREVMRLLGRRTERAIRSRLGTALADGDYEDAMAIALYRLWDRRDQFDPSVARLDRWFYALARNAALDLLRHRRRRPEDPAGDDLERVPAPVVRTADEARTEEPSRLRRDMRIAVERLPDVEQRILMSGRSDDELSAELDMKPGAIRTRRSRAKDKLKLALAEMGHMVTR